MSTRLTTEEAFRHLGITREALMALVHLSGVPAEIQPAWSCYAGVHGTRTARYKWRADRLDDWFDEVCAWRLSQRRSQDGLSDGAMPEDERLKLIKSPSPPSGGPTRSPKRSKKPSIATASGSLLDQLSRRR